MCTGNPLKGNLASSEDPDEMPHNVEERMESEILDGDRGLHCLLRQKKDVQTKKYNIIWK